MNDDYNPWGPEGSYQPSFNLIMKYYNKEELSAEERKKAIMPLRLILEEFTLFQFALFMKPALKPSFVLETLLVDIYIKEAGMMNRTEAIELIKNLLYTENSDLSDMAKAIKMIMDSIRHHCKSHFDGMCEVCKIKRV